MIHEFAKEITKLIMVGKVIIETGRLAKQADGAVLSALKEPKFW
ncbi:MAG: hypothetical protein U0T83_03680 [Bacteriovoracaceae bacterium]